jgi:hypothetical protein
LRKRIFFKLMFVFLLVIGATAITLQWTVHEAWERTLHEQIKLDLKQKVLMFAHRVEAGGGRPLADITSQEGQAAGARATVIDPTGKVLADSEADPTTQQPSPGSSVCLCGGADCGRGGAVSVSVAGG